MSLPRLNSFINDQYTMHTQPNDTRIAIFASGAGSNAHNIISFFAKHTTIHVALIVCNKPGAGVLSHAKHFNIPVLLIEKEKFFSGDSYIPELDNAGINFIVLAGFLWKVPDAIIEKFTKRIINLHPALLPAHGGKGMYGARVHAAVIAAREKLSGITIHYVDGKYDNGDVIFQATCTVDEGETIETLAEKIHSLEYKYLSPVIEECITKVVNNSSDDSL